MNIPPQQYIDFSVCRVKEFVDKDRHFQEALNGYIGRQVMDFSAMGGQITQDQLSELTERWTEEFFTKVMLQVIKEYDN